MRTSLLVISLTLLLTACGGRAIPAGGGDAGLRVDGDPGPAGKVTVTTNLRSYGLSQAASGTVYNGLDHSIFLPGCSIFNRQFRASPSDPWQDRGPDMMCGWEGEAREVKPGASQKQTARFGEPGQWRLTLRYGVGCKLGVPLSEAKCAAMADAVSAPVTVTVDKAACIKINEQYRAALEPARKCNPYINMVQCRELVRTDLACGCQTYVQAPAMLRTLAERYAALSCHKLMPPCSIKCSPPAPSGCGKDGLCYK